MQDFSFIVHIFKEGDSYVAYVPALDVSSCGARDEEARRNIRDAVRGFLAASAGWGRSKRFFKNPATSEKAGSGTHRNLCRLTGSRRASDNHGRAPACPLSGTRSDLRT